ncbi:CTP-dependent diacylglycerol kinase 1 [Beauveria bassiana D1-5]|uniref:CTP-dependent diacylglycerol kinase 1 n=1 Tax=Beauveria bassiana D1-5 TaxID=1245745 RepID=A0A0A2VMS4_BEABA|nr:CTP-dependent diacylglycerol kinase 1 [Beauveria bassiana D1-5]
MTVGDDDTTIIAPVVSPNNTSDHATAPPWSLFALHSHDTARSFPHQPPPSKITADDHNPTTCCSPIWPSSFASLRRILAGPISCSPLPPIAFTMSLRRKAAGTTPMSSIDTPPRTAEPSDDVEEEYTAPRTRSGARRRNVPPTSSSNHQSAHDSSSDADSVPAIAHDAAHHRDSHDDNNSLVAQRQVHDDDDDRRPRANQRRLAGAAASGRRLELARPKPQSQPAGADPDPPALQDVCTQARGAAQGAARVDWLLRGVAVLDGHADERGGTVPHDGAGARGGDGPLASPLRARQPAVRTCPRGSDARERVRRLQRRHLVPARRMVRALRPAQGRWRHERAAPQLVRHGRQHVWPPLGPLHHPPAPRQVARRVARRLCRGRRHAVGPMPGDEGFMFKNVLALPAALVGEENRGDWSITGSLALGVMSLVSGVVASASEVVDIFGWDDNLTIPVLSGLGIYGFLKVFG